MFLVWAVEESQLPRCFDSGEVCNGVLQPLKTSRFLEKKLIES